MVHSFSQHRDAVSCLGTKDWPSSVCCILPLLRVFLQLFVWGPRSFLAGHLIGPLFSPSLRCVVVREHVSVDLGRLKSGT